MRALLDASTLLTLVRTRLEDSVDILLDSATIALAHYEVGNALRTDTELTRSSPPKKPTGSST